MLTKHCNGMTLPFPLYYILHFTFVLCYTPPQPQLATPPPHDHGQQHPHQHNQQHEQANRVKVPPASASKQPAMKRRAVGPPSKRVTVKPFIYSTCSVFLCAHVSLCVSLSLLPVYSPVSAHFYLRVCVSVSVQVSVYFSAYVFVCFFRFLFAPPLSLSRTLSLYTHTRTRVQAYTH